MAVNKVVKDYDCAEEMKSSPDKTAPGRKLLHATRSIKEFSGRHKTSRPSSCPPSTSTIVDAAIHSLDKSSKTEGKKDGPKQSRKEQEWLEKGNTMDPVMAMFGPNHARHHQSLYRGKGPFLELEDGGSVTGLKENERIPENEISAVELAFIQRRKYMEDNDLV